VVNPGEALSRASGRLRGSYGAPGREGGDRPNPRSTAVLRPWPRRWHDRRLHGDDPVGPGDAGKSSQGLQQPGFAYLLRGQSNGAIQDYDQAIRLNPNDAVSYLGSSRMASSKS
jgi:hypothetical protein